MATIPKLSALFETSLASSLSAAGTSMTLVSATDRDGNALSGLFAFIIDEGSASEEFVVGTVSGTTVTLSIRGCDADDPVTSVAANKKAHRRGASVKITDYPILGYLKNVVNGDYGLPNKLTYESHPTFSSNTELVDKKYVDDTVTSGAPDASTTVKGLMEEATQAEIDADTAAGGTAARLAVNPSTLATSKYGTRLPSSSEKSALASTTTPGSGNKYITQQDFQKGAEIYAADSVGTDAYAVTLSPAVTGYTTGMTIRFKAGTANTGAATLNVNALGAKTIKKNVSADLETGDILANQVVTVIYDGTNFQLQSRSSADAGSYACGVSSRNGNTASGNEVIAHGLGRVPRLIRLTVTKGTASVSVGTYNGTTSCSVYTASTNGGGYDNTNVIHLADSSGDTDKQTATVTVDATNITVAWTKTGSPTVTNTNLMWEAYA